MGRNNNCDHPKTIYYFSVIFWLGLEMSAGYAFKAITAISAEIQGIGDLKTYFTSLMSTKYILK